LAELSLRASQELDSLIKEPKGLKFLQWCSPCLHLRWQGFRVVDKFGSLPEAFAVIYEITSEEAALSECGQYLSQDLLCLSFLCCIILLALLHLLFENRRRAPVSVRRCDPASHPHDSTQLFPVFLARQHLLQMAHVSRLFQSLSGNAIALSFIFADTAVKFDIRHVELRLPFTDFFVQELHQPLGFFPVKLTRRFIDCLRVCQRTGIILIESPF
jgi:hypothetical protein